MALRSPTSNHNYRGSFASAAQLPNVSGATQQNATLETGDVAYVVDRLYVCTTATVGAAVWLALTNDAAGSRRLWQWNGVDTSQFTEITRDTGVDGSLGVENHPDYGFPVLKFEKAAVGNAGFVVFNINDFVLPSSGRFLVRARIGPRAPQATPTVGDGIVYGDNTIPMVFPIIHEGSQHSVFLFRAPATRTLLSCAFSNGATFSESTLGAPNACSLGAQGDAGSVIEIFVEFKHPTVSTDPDIRIRIQTFGNVERNSATWLPLQAGAHVSWRTANLLLSGVGFYGYTGAGKTYLSDLIIMKHPCDE